MTTTTFPISGRVDLDGRIGHGAFTVTMVDGLSEIEVTLTARTPDSDVVDRTTVELRGGTLHIAGPRQGGIFDLIGGKSRDAIDIDVRLPSGSPVKIGAFTATITVRGRCGRADIAAAASDVDLDQVDGPLRLRYGSGTCRVARVSGAVQTRSGSGTVHLGEVGGAVSAACGSGELDVTVVRGAIRSRAGSGTVTLGAVFGDVDLQSGSGAMSIGLPSGVSARLDLTTGSGRVDSELPISAAPLPVTGRPITIRARTGTGDVRVVRAA